MHFSRPVSGNICILKSQSLRDVSLQRVPFHNYFASPMATRHR